MFDIEKGKERQKKLMRRQNLIPVAFVGALSVFVMFSIFYPFHSVEETKQGIQNLADQVQGNGKENTKDPSKISALEKKRLKSMERKVDTDLPPYYYPKYRDSYGVCGIAKSFDGNTIAVMDSASDNCPTEESLEQAGYHYIKGTDEYRPEKKDGRDCGIAHLEKGTNHISRAEFEEISNELGDVENIPVMTDKEVCPSIPELSEVLTNAIGEPIRFNYNEININQEGYEVIDFADISSQTITTVEMMDEGDISIADDYGEQGKRMYDINGDEIPVLLQLKEAQSVCGDDLKACRFDSKNYLLKNENTGEEFGIQTKNGYYLPKFMLTRKAFSVCQGDFMQCDYYPDANGQLSGTVTNPITSESYKSPIPFSVTMTDENSSMEQGQMEPMESVEQAESMGMMESPEQ